MSVKCTVWAWGIKNLKGTQKLVLLALADTANDDGECWPGIERIADKCCISRSSLIQIITKLVDMRLIEKNKRFDDKGLSKTNLYRLNLELSPESGPPTKNEQGFLDEEDKELKKHEKFKNQKNKGPESVPLGPRVQNLDPNLKDIMSYNNNIKNKNISDDIFLQKSSRKKPVVELPENFQVTQKHIDYATEKSLPDPSQEIDKFMNYHASKGNKFADWDRAFFNWLINAKKFNTQKENNYAIHQQNPQKSRLEQYLEKLRRTTEQYEREQLEKSRQSVFPASAALSAEMDDDSWFGF